MIDPDEEDQRETGARNRAAEGGTAARPRRRRAHRIGLWTLAVAGILALAMIFAVLAVTGRTIVLPNAVTERIEAKINRDLNGPRVSIGRIVAMVDRNLVPRVTARNVGLIDASGAEIARLNELRAILSREALRAGRLRPDALRVSGAQITVRRRADGSFAFDFGGARGSVGSAAEVLEAVDRAFSTEPLSTIARVDLREITVTLEDAHSGRIWSATDAGASLRNTPQDIDITLDFELFNGTEELSRVAMGFTSQKGSLATTMSLSVEDAPTRDFALQAPALSFLSVVDAPVSASMRGRVGATGLLEDYTGSLEIGAGRIVAEEGAPPLAFEGAKGYFDYDPDRERISFPQFTLATDALDIEGSGQILLGEFDGVWPRSFTGQWRFGRIRVAPEGLFSEPLTFDRGFADVRMRLAPFRLDLGTLDLGRGDLWLRGSGRAAAGPEGWDAALDLSVDEITNAQLLGLWPPAAIAKTRAWMAQNIAAATYRDLDLALRLSPGQSRPVFALDWDFDGLDMRFMASQPPVAEGRGYGTIFGNAMTIAMDGGTITPPQGGPVEVAGTVLRIPDITAKPARMEIGLHTRSRIEAGLSLMAEPPFSILRAAPFGPDVAEGTAEIRGDIAFPLVQKLTLPDVGFALEGTLENVSSDRLMPGQVLSAERLALDVDPEGLSIGGAARVGTAAVTGEWRKRFGPDQRGRSDVAGRVTIDQALLDTFGIVLPEGMVAGEAAGALSVALRQGEAPRFEITSDLAGLRLSFPPLGWGKPPGTRGQLTLAGLAGERPEISELSLSGAGLEAQGGRVSLGADGGLDRLSFERFALGSWLDVAGAVVGQGKGKAVAVEVTGGRLDLPRATFGGGAGGGGTPAIPISARLDRVTLARGQELRNVSARLSAQGGVTGSFTGALNGRATLNGTLTPGTYGPTITLGAEDAGAVISASGVIERATGGRLYAALTALPGKAGYDGRVVIDNLRVHSAPTLAELLSAVSVVGLIDQMAGGGGILFTRIQGDFTLLSGRLSLRGVTAEGPSLGISLEGLYDTAANTVDFQGVISPVYFLNALGQIVSRRGEGLFGFTYTLTGPATAPSVGVNPLSILTPGAMRDIFRRKPAGQPR
ncbi:AsmA-like C-terminal region-containing protein [Celeribacter indicus]|uniref:Uncharacterized protein n=1 Tax=Celeribacter indicus TaxID=1208324 RepID=A0A0B5DYR3_9RHOB|nr:AsmA-like C-terminal region-containing protein [Celeribacter indicus]AJE46325.1 hypothetical protein P73_1610 [Celeribacter indicus]SDW53423.1 AsmA-like C-terminal region [Celeribacter indicus]